MSWFSDHAVLCALLCAGAAVIYGLGLTRWILAQPAGTERMQEIARHEEGASMEEIFAEQVRAGERVGG